MLIIYICILYILYTLFTLYIKRKTTNRIFINIKISNKKYIKIILYIAIKAY